MLTVQDCNMLCNFAELVVREVEKKHVVRMPSFTYILNTQQCRYLQNVPTVESGLAYTLFEIYCGRDFCTLIATGLRQQMRQVY